MTLATVVLPTHNNGALLRHAVRSVLRQTVDDFELFVLGDGATPETRTAALECAAWDPRVQFFDLPKGERHGERLRHTLLGDAKGTIVCYLSDDDLWLPTHLEYMCQLLGNADFAHGLPLYIAPTDQYRLHLGHFDCEAARREMSRGVNFVPLSAAAHTIEAYRRLPFGWRPAPRSTPTDLYMWQQWMESGARVVSGSRPTLVTFPKPLRLGWSPAERLRELEYWSAKVGDPRCESEVAARVIDLLVRSRVDLHYAVEDLTLRGEGLTRQRDNLSRELVATRHHCEMVRHASELAIQEARQRSRDRIRDDISELLAALPLQIEAWTLPLRSHTETVDRLVEERESLIATVASVRAELVALQAQIGDVELQRAKLERERGELLAIIRSVEAGVLWRLRALLLKLPGVASLLRGYQQWRREPQVTHPKPS